jgi:hypothetical protein
MEVLYLLSYPGGLTLTVALAPTTRNGAKSFAQPVV